MPTCHYDYYGKNVEPFAVYFRLIDKEKEEHNTKLYHLPHLPSEGDIINYEDKNYRVDAVIWTLEKGDVSHVNIIGYQVF